MRSFSAHLGQQLDEYVSRLDKVKIVRAKQREGLIRFYSFAKLVGGRPRNPLAQLLSSGDEQVTVTPVSLAYFNRLKQSVELYFK